MNKTSTKKKSPFILIAACMIAVAGLADIKYRGLFFRLLPESVQSFLAQVIK
ncbi:hypothetical protein [Oceanobacillus profundus]|uniref:hypothetical protein n=1 Tax=Oceanobacillus profundus TaxID=372463 RepID=UPI00203D43DD|nr:hypothetical protein [Oceanobacillus profundus]MBR3117950.1 hypothetical protein [Oceanobacillus sp.]MCM3398658.1 hypothetical protein [Oceanobacillus profundus]